MKIFNYLLLFVLAFCWNNMKAQVTDFSPQDKGTTSSTEAYKTATNSSPIENSVRNNLIIIQQNYQLKDVTMKKNNLYGRGGKKHFGTVYTVGVKSENGYYTNGRAVLPWLYDSNYSKYSSNDQYQPVISETNYRLWGVQKYQKLKFNSDPGKLSQDSILFVKRKLSEPMLPIDPSTGNQKGWIVWVVKNNKATEPDAFFLSTQATELKFNASTGMAELKGSAPQQVVFGLFVTQQENKRGQIVTALSGFAIKGDGKWLVKKPAVVTSTNTTKNNVIVVNPDELTPTKK